MITKEQIEKWVRACNLYALNPEVNMDEPEYIRFEQLMIIALCAAELGVHENEVMNDALPPIVCMAMMAGRPLRSIYATGQEEKTRLKASLDC